MKESYLKPPLFLQCKLYQNESFRNFSPSIGFPGGSVVNNPYANARDVGDVSLIPVSGRSTGGRNSYLENPMDREAWQATVHRVPKSQT